MFSVSVYYTTLYKASFFYKILHGAQKICIIIIEEIEEMKKYLRVCEYCKARYQGYFDLWVNLCPSCKEVTVEVPINFGKSKNDNQENTIRYTGISANW